ncbi:MAG: SDR family oxidoreductase [Proteobacteria bacterium]|nr:SDR family oxidoreductase [Pseudomonadota bacterium]MBI3499357.1 SDR family oxidoreductase [Pseudomonadota bacterium]
MTKRLFCFGLGYTGQALAHALAKRAWEIAGTSRGPEGIEALRGQGFDALAFDRDRPIGEPAHSLGQATHLLSTVPPDREGDPVLGRHGTDIARLSGLKWIGYLSTTGVYGDRGGAWVDEWAELRPTGERGRRRQAAEAAWLDLRHRHGLPVHVFRLAGIYGPGRSALDQLGSGRARRIIKPGQVFSRIHVDDIVAVLMASMARPNPGAIYNLADDEATAPATVIEFAASLLGIDPPPAEPFESASLSDMAASFYRDSKRVSNRRIKEELGVRLAFPTYREGLQHLHAAMTRK